MVLYMNILKMNKFGKILTGREFGKDSMKTLILNYPVTLDFIDVISLGSSFADEVIVPIAAKQDNRIKVCNVSTPVWDCIQDVTKDHGITVKD